MTRAKNQPEDDLTLQDMHDIEQDEAFLELGLSQRKWKTPKQCYDAGLSFACSAIKDIRKQRGTRPTDEFIHKHAHCPGVITAEFGKRNFPATKKKT